MANLGPIPVPDKLVPLLPYVKAAIAALGVVASVLIVVLGAGTPAYVYVIVSVVTALGVYTVPNADVKAVLQDGAEAVDDGKAALKAAETGDIPNVEADLHKAELSANGALGGAEAILKNVDPALLPTPPLPVKPNDQPEPPPHDGVIT